jgi:hypothetical protein
MGAVASVIRVLILKSMGEDEFNVLRSDAAAQCGIGPHDSLLDCRQIPQQQMHRSNGIQLAGGKVSIMQLALKMQRSCPMSL